MPTTLEARFAEINEIIRSTGKKLAALAQLRGSLKEGDPRAEHIKLQFMEINKQRQEALDEQGRLIEAATVALKIKMERLEQLRRGEK
jgi:biopolymer transport protein ExbB/TolQ